MIRRVLGWELEPLLPDEMSPSQHVRFSTKAETMASTMDVIHSKAHAVCQYFGDPEPPEDLWDVDDLQFMDKVRCRASIRIIGIDPKNGCFHARMKCHWNFRTANNRDRTDIHLWVPGIRMPGLVTTCEESRLWRDHDRTTDRTIFWCGTSLFSISGYEIFEMEDFPFDRQMIDLELLEFVWRREKDSANFDASMKVVSFTVETASLLPEWSAYPATVHPESELLLGSGPAFASRFFVKLRIEREHWFYVVQIFLVTYLITTVSCFPLAMPPTAEHVGDRLSLYGGGCLTLVAFRYGIVDHLPSVPYSTFADYFMLWQVVTIMVLAAETLVVYRVATDPDTLDAIDVIENVLLCLVTLVWLVFFLFAAFFKRRQQWKWVFQHQDKNQQVMQLDD